jgi:hypothetical protein
MSNQTYEEAIVEITEDTNGDEKPGDKDPEHSSPEDPEMVEQLDLTTEEKTMAQKAEEKAAEKAEEKGVDEPQVDDFNPYDPMSVATLKRMYRSGRL